MLTFMVDVIAQLPAYTRAAVPWCDRSRYRKAEIVVWPN